MPLSGAIATDLSCNESKHPLGMPLSGAIACVTGGPERRTLFCLSAATSPEELRQRKSSARIEAIDVEIPGAGYP
jgi:sugar lactone lactonase YvrE